MQRTARVRSSPQRADVCTVQGGVAPSTSREGQCAGACTSATQPCTCSLPVSLQTPAVQPGAATSTSWEGPAAPSPPWTPHCQGAAP